jgi:nucleoside-diphosphate kinase
MLEQSFVIIKPDHIDSAVEILGELDNYGRRLITRRVKAVPQEVIEAHYSVHQGKSFFDYMTSSFIGKEVVIAVYQNDDVIRKLREAAGPTDPAKAPKETIRGKYSNDSLEQAITEKRPVRNVVHCSDGPAEAEREIGVWAKYLK